MNQKQIVRDVLRDWSYWEQPPKSEVTRIVDLPNKLHNDLVLVIQGVRRCGKSTLLSQLPQHYQLPIEQCVYCNFEDPRLLNQLDYRLLDQIVALTREHIANNKPCYFFLDEIQNVTAWEKWLHMQLEKPKNNYFVITGSNASLLSGELGTALTGRHIVMELFPFSIREYQSIKINSDLTHYLMDGGFPKALNYEQPYRLLQEYFNDILLRDVLRSVHSRSPDTIKQVVKMVYDSCGSELSYRKIAATVGVTVDTVKTYLYASEQGYLLFACPFFAFSEKKRQLRQKKYYPIDTAMRFAVTGNSGRDLGKSLEIAVFLQLKKIYGQVYYWQAANCGEVDFVIRQNNKIIPYQITWEGEEARHLRSMQHFYEAFPQAEDTVFITQHNAAEFLAT